MRYSFEFKVQCVEMYRQGRWPDTPAGVTQQRFRNNILLWKRTADACGLDALFHKNQNRGWTAENRYELVAKVLAGNSYTSVAIDAGINPGQRILLGFALQKHTQKIKKETQKIAH